MKTLEHEIENNLSGGMLLQFY